MEIVANRYEIPTQGRSPKNTEEFLLHHAKLSDPGTKELLALVSRGNENSRTRVRVISKRAVRDGIAFGVLANSRRSS